MVAVSRQLSTHIYIYLNTFTSVHLTICRPRPFPTQLCALAIGGRQTSSQSLHHNSLPEPSQAPRDPYSLEPTRDVLGRILERAMILLRHHPRVGHVIVGIVDMLIKLDAYGHTHTRTHASFNPVYMYVRHSTTRQLTGAPSSCLPLQLTYQHRGIVDRPSPVIPT